MTLSGRVLAIDYGERRLGIAVSDPLNMFAIGLETLVVHPKQPAHQTLKKTLAAIQALCQQYAVCQLVVGLPKRMDGTEGQQAEVVREFVRQLQACCPCPVTLLDERLTSVWAEHTMQQMGLKPSRNKAKVDQLAASRLLQDYLDQQQRQSPSR